MLRASLEDRATAEIRLTNPSEQSVVSSLSSSSLTSKDTAKTTADEHQLLKTPELQSSILGGRPKGSTKAKKKQDLSDASKCTDAIVLEYSRKYNTSKSVGQKVEYGYLKRLIDEKKNKFGINYSISSKTIKNVFKKLTDCTAWGQISVRQSGGGPCSNMNSDGENLSHPILHQNYCANE